MTKGSSSATAMGSAADGQKRHQAEPLPAWPIEHEMNLFSAMRGHKPVGVDRHFQMLYISEKLNAAQRERGLHPIPIREIWTLLDGLYSMPALHDSEVLPFPNREVEFCLPADSPDWKPVLAMDFPRVQSAAAAVTAPGNVAAAVANSPGLAGEAATATRKRGRPPRGTASPQATPSSRSHSPAPSSEAGDSVAGSGGGSLYKKPKRGALI